MKNIIFIGRSRITIKSFPQNVKREAGYQLDKVQKGKDPTDWKPMNIIGNGVREIRIKDVAGIYRVCYIARMKDSIFVLHAFKKKTQKTSKLDLEIAKSAYENMLETIKL